VRGAALVVVGAVGLQLFGLGAQVARSLLGLQQGGERRIALAFGLFQQGLQ
jgi:hypothetical protein